MKVSIVVCTYNRDKYILTCLQHIEKQTCRRSSFELIIINNNCTDKTDEICTKFISEFPDLNIQYYIEHQPGLSYARNKGIELAKGEFIIFIDDDGFMFPNYLSNLIKHIDSIPDLAAFGGKILPKYESKEPEWMSKWLNPLVSIINMGDEISFFKNKSYPIGANMGIKKDVFSQIGNFDINLGRKAGNLLGGEEKDLFFRIKNLNKSIHYLPDTVIYHIIPDNRLTKDFIRKIGIGIGHSEKIRSRQIGIGSYFGAIIKEIMKWGATFLLSFLYLFQHWKKSEMLLLFRYNVSRGLIQNKI